MSKNKSFSKTPLIILGIIFCLVIIGGGVYYFGFYPKVPVESITTPVDVNKWNLATKLIPDSVNINLKEISAESNIELTDDELTKLFIAALQQSPEAKEYVSGLKVDIENNDINLYLDAKYKNIPMQGKLIFTASAEDGKGILHYKDGKIGFIKVPTDTLFSLLGNQVKGNSMIKLNKDNSNVVIDLNKLQGVDIKNVSVHNNALDLVVTGTIKF